MPKTHTCGVPGCKNKGTLCLPPIGPLRDDWYRLLQLSTNSQSHRICGIHFDPCDLGKSGKKKRRDVKPTRNLPLNQNPSEHQIQQYLLSSDLKQHKLETQPTTDVDPLEIQPEKQSSTDSRAGAILQKFRKIAPAPTNSESDPFESQGVDDDDFEMEEEIYLCDLCSFKCNDIKEYEHHCAALCNHRIIELEEQSDSLPKELVPDKPNEIDLKTDHVSLHITKMDLAFLSYPLSILKCHVNTVLHNLTVTLCPNNSMF